MLNLAYVTLEKSLLSDSSQVQVSALPERLLDISQTLGASSARVRFGYIFLNLVQGNNPNVQALLAGPLKDSFQARLVYTRIGNDAFHAGKYIEAELAWRQAEVALPKSQNVLMLASEAYHKRDLQLAADYYRFAAHLNPESVITWRKLAEVLSEAKDTAGAIRALQSLDTLGLADVDDFLQLGHLLRSPEQSRYDEARRYYLRATSLDASRPEPIEGLIWIDLATGQFKEAGDKAHVLVERFSSCVDCLNTAGHAFLIAQDYANAIQVLRDALVFRPDDDWLHDLIGQAYIPIDKAQAEQHLLRSVELGPDVAAHLVHLGDFYLAEGKTELAIQFYLQSLALEPDGPDKAYVLERLQGLEK